MGLLPCFCPHFLISSLSLIIHIIFDYLISFQSHHFHQTVPYLTKIMKVLCWWNFASSRKENDWLKKCKKTMSSGISLLHALYSRPYLSKYTSSPQSGANSHVAGASMTAATAVIISRLGWSLVRPEIQLLKGNKSRGAETSPITSKLAKFQEKKKQCNY